MKGENIMNEGEESTHKKGKLTEQRGYSTRKNDKTYS
jgi:hypothetical protein